MSLSISSSVASFSAQPNLTTASASTDQPYNSLSSGYVAGNNETVESAPAEFTAAPTVAFQPPPELQAGSTSGPTTLPAANAAYSAHDHEAAQTVQDQSPLLKMLQ
jgi:hypothetical protein